MKKYASMMILSASLAPTGAKALRSFAHRHSFTYEPRPGYLYVRSRAISSRCNDNFDEFPAEEIKKAYATFVGKPVFVNHHNDNHRRARGVIIDAALHEDRNPDGSPDTWAEVLMEVDAAKFPKLAKAILAGHVDRTSMGTDVAFSKCSVCNNKATNPTEYCQHIPKMKGQRIYRTTASGRKEGILVREICHGLGFFENSLLVEEPADPTAYTFGVDDRGLKMSATLDVMRQADRAVNTGSEFSVVFDRTAAKAPANQAVDDSGGDPKTTGVETGNCATCGKVIHKVRDSAAGGWQHDIQGAAGVPHQAFPQKTAGHILGHPLDCNCAYCGAPSIHAEPKKISEDERAAHEQAYRKSNNIPADQPVHPSHYLPKGSTVWAAKFNWGKSPAPGATARVPMGRARCEDCNWTGKREDVKASFTCPDCGNDRISLGERDMSQYPDRRHTTAGKYRADPTNPLHQHLVNEHAIDPHLLNKRDANYLHGLHHDTISDELPTSRDGVIDPDGLGSHGEIGHANTFHVHDSNDPLRFQASKLAYGETMAPADVDTLRDEECPVCGEADAYDGNECQVCGFVTPPKMFLDPDVDMAKNLDLRKDVAEAGAPGEDLNGDGMPDSIPGSTAPGSDATGEVDPTMLDENGMPIDPETGKEVDPNDPTAQPLDPNDPTAQQDVDPDNIDPQTGLPVEVNDDVDPNQMAPDGQANGFGSGMPGEAGDGVPDLICPNCGFEVDSAQPTSVNTADPAAVPPGAAQGDVCPNCQKALLESISDAEGEGLMPAPPQGAPVGQAPFPTKG